MAQNDKAQAQVSQASAPATIELRPTNMKHVYLCDWFDDGVLHEIAVLMKAPDGAVYGIDVNNLHKIDKARLKRFITSVHADKYELWELLSRGTLNNGVNALDFFHQNYVKVKRPRGAVVGGSLASIDAYAGSSAMIGSEYSDPRSATFDRNG